MVKLNSKIFLFFVALGTNLDAVPGQRLLLNPAVMKRTISAARLMTGNRVPLGVASRAQHTGAASAAARAGGRSAGHGRSLVVPVGLAVGTIASATYTLNDPGRTEEVLRNEEMDFELMRSVQLGYSGMVEFFINRGANVNCEYSGNTPLTACIPSCFYAGSFKSSTTWKCIGVLNDGLLETVKLLLARGAYKGIDIALNKAKKYEMLLKLMLKEVDRSGEYESYTSLFNTSYVVDVKRVETIAQIIHLLEEAAKSRSNS